MGWTLALRPREIESFHRCLRAWDLGSRVRQNYVPVVDPSVFDFDRAMRDALAVYYFPAMDDWDRKIVRPLALQAFQRKMREHRARYEAHARLDAGQERAWREQLERGERILRHYFAWCAGVDDFDSIFADHELRAPIPDPANPGIDLVAPDGRALRYVGRIDLLMSEGDAFWVVDHRMTMDGWADGAELLADWVSLSSVWAIQLCYPNLKIAGNVYNEIRADAAPPAGEVPIPQERDERTMTGSRHVNRRRDYLSPTEEAEERPDLIVRLETGEGFRRTYVRRSKEAVARIAERIAADARAVNAPSLPIVPNHSEANCSRCVFRVPCDAMDAGLDPSMILAARFRRRSERESLDEENLRYSPVREAAAEREDRYSRTVRMLWG